MAHFAQIVNGIVTSVVVVPDEHEGDGEAFLNILGLTGQWLQTSYNTYGNWHPNNKPFRYNYAGIGYSYDETKDAFIPPQPYPSWVLNKETCLWEPPFPSPSPALTVWDESTISWATADPISEQGDH
jgi:hypothetical protein